MTIEENASEIKLAIDETNSLVFNVKIEGDVTGVPAFRLVCEGDGLSLCFEGRSDGPDVRFDIPSLKGVIKEGTRSARLETIIGDRLLVPLSFSVVFTAPTAVTVESIRRVESKPKPQAAASATIVAKHPNAASIIAQKKPEIVKQQQNASRHTLQEKKHTTLRELFKKPR